MDSLSYKIFTHTNFILFSYRFEPFYYNRKEEWKKQEKTSGVFVPVPGKRMFPGFSIFRKYKWAWRGFRAWMPYERKLGNVYCVPRFKTGKFFFEKAGPVK